MTYEVNGVQYSVDSTANQNILEQLVNREVMCCMTSEVEYLLKRLDDIDNPVDESMFENSIYPICTECGCPVVPSDGESDYICVGCGCRFGADEYECLDTDYAEPLEWWAVSAWFGEKLAKRGEFVIHMYGKAYWGRTCSGQGISADGVITDIAIDMQILKGMKYSW